MIELYGGMTVEGGSAELQRLLILRSGFSEVYAKTKGWAWPLSLEQVMEIRSQEGWKRPVEEVQ